MVLGPLLKRPGPWAIRCLTRRVALSIRLGLHNRRDDKADADPKGGQTHAMAKLDKDAGLIDFSI